jgi:hypothetical protein
MVMNCDRTPPYQRRGLRVLSTAVLERESRQRYGAVQSRTGHQREAVLKTADGLGLAAIPQHHLDQQQAREEAANLCWRFLAGIKS